ncbi:carbonic anhydrase family protein [Tenacibaculum sp.]|nr:carbonic anhydrase family protein [Tenacibaculum sp.]
MKKNVGNYLFRLLLILIMISCENEKIDINHKTINQKDETSLGNSFYGRSSKSDCHFDYEGSTGPEFWANLCGEDWKDCAGNSQSPINIITNNVINDGTINNINTNYTVSTIDVINNGHTLQFNYNTGSSASLNNIDYNLLQFHFHTESEHTVDGHQYPMEMHLVHQDPLTKLLGVVGVFFKEGKKNKALSKLMKHLPEHGGDSFKSNKEYHIKDLLPNDMEFYTYSGSLTTPACSEIVTWYVIKHVVEASEEQLEKFKEIMHLNFRPIQSLNDRTVKTKY